MDCILVWITYSTYTFFQNGGIFLIIDLLYKMYVVSLEIVNIYIFLLEYLGLMRILRLNHTINL